MTGSMLLSSGEQPCRGGRRRAGTRADTMLMPLQEEK